MIITFLLGISLSSQAFAQEGSKSYSSDFWSRSTLTGDWGGMRNDLAKKGVTFDLNLTQIAQGNVSGGKKIGWEYGGRGDLTLNIDTQKLGLWPGGFFTVEVEGNFDNAVNNETGALMPVNTNQIFPMPASDQLNIPAVTFISSSRIMSVCSLESLTPCPGMRTSLPTARGTHSSSTLH